MAFVVSPNPTFHQSCLGKPREVSEFQRFTS